MSAQPQPPTSTQTPPRGSFVGRLAAALLVILITTALSLGAVAAGFFGLGFTLDTPRRLAQAQAENAALQTRVADLERRASDSRESLDQVRGNLAEISGMASRLAESDLRSATLAAEARASRDAVALFATAEAERAGLLTTLQRRSERVERFVQRLGDISQDAASDLAGAPVARTTVTATAAAGTATPSPAPPTAPAPTASSGATGVATQSATPTAAASPTAIPAPSTSSTATPAASAAPTGTPSRSPSATGTPAATPASTPTLGR